MSTSPDAAPSADDRLVTVISRWLARHLSDEELRAELAAGRGGAELDMVARETLEALALGG